jgi:hypothetical protein
MPSQMPNFSKFPNQKLADWRSLPQASLAGVGGLRSGWEGGDVDLRDEIALRDASFRDFLAIAS